MRSNVDFHIGTDFAVGGICTIVLLVIGGAIYGTIWLLGWWAVLVPIALGTVWALGFVFRRLAGVQSRDFWERWSDD